MNLLSRLKSWFESHPHILAIRDRVRTRFQVRVDTTPVHTHFFSIIYIGVSALILWSVVYGIFWRSPRPFPEAALVTIERGETLAQVAQSFEEQNVIRSAFWMKLFVRLTGGDRRVIAGDYYFPEPVSIFTVISQIHKGRFGLVPMRVTIQEGLSSYDIATILDKELPAFSAEDFLEEVDDNGYEGTLFPDTYFFMPNTRSSEVILTMRENFARQISPYKEDIEKSQKSLEELVIMGSIVEGEANHKLEDKRIVAGILWNRLRLKMPMQVDAPFRYYNGKHSYTLTKVDLGEDHPYNTYVNKGLPPTAINNPGIDSLRAAIAPTNTKYLYFMSDKSGNMYYAINFQGHQNNRELYLR